MDIPLEDKIHSAFSARVEDVGVDRFYGRRLKLTKILIEHRIHHHHHKEHHMAATVGAVTFTTAGQQATASILGFDQFGNPWTGEIPPVSYSIDNADIATSTPNADGITDVVTAVANGTANLTASLTTAEGLALTDTEQVIVNIPVVPPPTPVLTSIKIGFGS